MLSKRSCAALRAPSLEQASMRVFQETMSRQGGAESNMPHIIKVAALGVHVEEVLKWKPSLMMWSWSCCHSGRELRAEEALRRKGKVKLSGWRRSVRE
ncbi:hypothetical protein AMTR_s00061p00035830 [Amborella trichopoda]|uniref:Uncharacterized protein n=1 Tax=Amborella trichopoda TaxID=13333 RepID=U5DF09_AMBTC|nr:hypothetical protein AMTR_s00061p00035830 [Amborella trichopoda]